MTPHRRLVIALMASAALLSATPARAQDRPVVFVHGLNSDGGAWESAGNLLQAHLAIDAYWPTLPGPSYGDQANELNGQLGWLPSSTVAVGHSNGGIVSRHWSGVHDISGVLTLSTPHRGAPIFAHVADWINFNLLAFDLIGGVSAAFGASYDDSWWVYAAIQGVLSLTTQGAQDAILQLGGTLGLRQWLPIFPEMIPGSGYLSALNSSGNLAREASAVPARVGIVNVAHNFYWGGVFRAVWPQNGDQISGAIHASAAVLDYYAGYLWSSPNPIDWQRAQKISSVAWWLWVHEEIWCRTISDPSPYAYSASGFCAENDTIVPTWSQVYPNATNIELRGTPAHVEQTEGMTATVYEALVTFMPVYPRGAEPPPNPPNPPPPPPPPPPSTSNTLYPGQGLGMQQEIRSTNDRFSLFYQADGNLVLYQEDGRPLWSSRTAGTSVGRAVMQDDGNFVIYDAGGNGVWDTGTHGNPGAVLILQDDGNLVLYAESGTPIWASGTSGS